MDGGLREWECVEWSVSVRLWSVRVDQGVNDLQATAGGHWLREPSLHLSRRQLRTSLDGVCVCVKAWRVEVI